MGYTIIQGKEQKKKNKKRKTPQEMVLKRYFKAYKKNAIKRGLKWNLSYKTFSKLTNSPCHYCGIIASNKLPYRGNSLYKTYTLSRNGIDRKKNNFGYSNSNAVSCCKTCNYAKRKMSPEEFGKWIVSVYKHFGVDFEDSV